MSEWTDAPRPDLTAADWAAMRARCAAMGTGWRLRRDTDLDGHETGYGTVWMPALPPMEPDIEWHLTDTCIPIEQAEFIFYAITDLPLALDALARQQEANARLTAENARLKEDGADHKGAEIADVHAEILHRAEHAEAALADRDATIARLREELQEIANGG